MQSVPRAITLVIPEGATLGHALSAALSSRGWTVLVRYGHDALTDVGGQDVVELVEDDHGNWTCGRPAVTVRTWVCIGSVRSLPGLLEMHRRGAVVLNQSAPMLTLVCHVESAVTRPTSLGPVAARVLRRRATEHVGLQLLTTTEEAVLRAMLAGASAAQIGLHRHASVNTVRTHIKAVLTKLGVRSQLEAVAVAHRAGCMEWLFDAMVKFTNSGDDDLECGGQQ